MDIRLSCAASAEGLSRLLRPLTNIVRGHGVALLLALTGGLAVLCPRPGRNPARRLPGVDRLQRAHQPDRAHLRPRRPRLRRREERPDQVLRRPRRLEATPSQTSAPRPITSGTAACSGSRSTPSSRRAPTSTRSTPSTPSPAARSRAGGPPGVSADPCPTPPGPTGDGCVVSGRLARLTIAGDTMSAKTNLLTDWCQQYPSHSIGDLGFGPDGALYVTGGDGASFNFIDWGQDGSPVNPCGDPPARRRRSDPADRRGWGAAKPGRADHRRPDGPRRSPASSRPRHRRGAGGQPLRGQL